MVLELLVLAGAVGVGFGLGGAKNSYKLAAAKAELAKFEAYGTAEEQKLVAEVKALLVKVGL